MASYEINPQDDQDAIVAFLVAKYPHIPVIPDGLLAGDHAPVQFFPDGSVKPFLVLWFSTLKRRSRGRAFVSHRLDQHFASVDVVAVARNGGEARRLMNDLSNELTDLKTPSGGRVHTSPGLWGAARSIDMQSRPTRFAATNRFDFPVATKVTP